MTPGRSCPLSYRYGARALADTPALRTETLWVVGGLYGNGFALDALLEAFDAERGEKALVFNGDFHWFDVDPDEFAAVNDAVLRFRATRGNVETELASPQDGAGCGCGYPEWVDDETVAHSNRIMARLRETAARMPSALAKLVSLPMHLRAEVGDTRVAIVHGDAESLAGWGFSQEALAQPGHAATMHEWFRDAQADIFASSHTCLPVLQRFSPRRVLVNNGAAGMPNFSGELFGLATRIALAPSSSALYGCRLGEVFVEAVPLRYDAAAWEKRFLAQWPAGSDAHASYHARITRGPCYLRSQALRTLEGMVLAASRT